MKEKVVISGVILGKVPSKSNSYKVVTIKGHGSISKEVDEITNTEIPSIKHKQNNKR